MPRRARMRIAGRKARSLRRDVRRAETARFGNRRYIELNSVRARMVDRPGEYRWSSYGVNAWGDKSPLFPPEEQKGRLLH